MKDFEYTDAQKEAIVAVLPAGVDAVELIQGLETTALVNLINEWSTARTASKAKLSEIADLSKALASALKSLSDPQDVGLGVESYLNGDGIEKFDRYPGRSEQERTELLAILSSIQAFTSDIVNAPTAPNALQWGRKNYLEVLLRRWVNRGGTFGGPKSNMVRFVQAASKPVLGIRSLTDAAVVAFAYTWRAEQAAHQRDYLASLTPEELEKQRVDRGRRAEYRRLRMEHKK
jgi:hypothetical protein